MTRVLELTGSPRERGRQHGEQLRDQIAARIASSLPPFGPDLADPWWRAIQRHDQVGLVDELQGIAEGSGASLDAIVLLNAFEAFAVADQVELGGCTAIGIPDRDGTLIAQNLDGNESLTATYAVHVHRRPSSEGPTTAMVASPGGLGWIGMSSHGVALVNNDLMTPTTRVGLPSQAVRRHALAAPTAAAALAAIVATPAVGGRCYMLGDARGDLVTVELAAESTPHHQHHTTATAHTNHALAPDIAAVEDEALLTATYPSTRSRLSRAQSLIAQATRPPLGSSALAAAARPDPGALARAVLTDHDGHPLSICRHPSPDEATVTGVTAYLDTATRRATFTFGHPCQATSTDIVEVTLSPP